MSDKSDTTICAHPDLYDRGKCCGQMPCIVPVPKPFVSSASRSPTTGPNLEAIQEVMKQIKPVDPTRVYRSAYSMVICAAGHHLTGEGEAPTKCPICKGQTP